jgi:uncharacterized LabA/DUF88 family protein
MEEKKENNYAFIDTQNIIRGVELLGWFLDWQRFHIYLQNKYYVTKAFLFIGYIKVNEKTYQELRNMGFEIIFKETYKSDGQRKGNIDVELTMQVLFELNNFDKAIIVSGDGDFHSLIKYLKGKDKFKMCISVLSDKTSIIIKKITAGSIVFMSELEKRISVLQK